MEEQLARKAVLEIRLRFVKFYKESDVPSSSVSRGLDLLLTGLGVVLA